MCSDLTHNNNDTDSLNDSIHQTEKIQTTVHYICKVDMM